MTTAWLLGVGCAIAQHDAGAQQSPKPKTDAELIANAMSAAPAAVSKDAVRLGYEIIVTRPSKFYPTRGKSTVIFEFIKICA